jgi:hypothetical protein
MPESPTTEKTEKQPSESEVGQRRIVSRLRGYLKDMDARITMERVKIREMHADVGRLEKEKWELESEIDKIEDSIG